MSIKIGGGIKIPTTIGKYGVDVGDTEFDFDRFSGDGSSGAPRVQTMSDEDVLSGLVNDMYGRFAPRELIYEMSDEEKIRSNVAAWLRPNYDQAIANRQEQTLAYKANLDADAISRGMGASTYVTDVKNRQQNAEARDIASLETDYGSSLAKYVSEGVASENDRVLETEKINAQLRQDAYELAYSAALQLFDEYKKQPRGGASGKSAVKATSLENCEAFLGMLSGEERRDIYDGTTASGERYRAELLASVGAAGYVQLMGKYPSAP
jgi:hypothetical protein